MRLKTPATAMKDSTAQEKTDERRYKQPLARTVF